MDSRLPGERQLSGSSDILQVQDVDNFQTYFEYEAGISSINVKNRLRNSLPFWKKINASDFILDVINSGYKIPFVKEPESVFLKK